MRRKIFTIASLLGVLFKFQRIAEQQTSPTQSLAGMPVRAASLKHQW